MRLILHTAAYWLMWAVRHAMPATATLRTAEFATIRLRLLKVAARIIETTNRVRIAFTSACSDAALFRSIALNLRTTGPRSMRQWLPNKPRPSTPPQTVNRDETGTSDPCALPAATRPLR